MNIRLPLLLALPLLLPALFAVGVGAQSTCIPIAYVRVIDGLGANVRSSPEVRSDNVVVGLRFADGEKVACEFRDGWYRIDNPAGWVSATYNSGRNPLLTVRQTATPTPTRTPTATATQRATVQPTPTRILHQVIYCQSGTIEQTPIAGLVRIECQIP